MATLVRLASPGFAIQLNFENRYHTAHTLLCTVNHNPAKLFITENRVNSSENKRIPVGHSTPAPLEIIQLEIGSLTL